MRWAREFGLALVILATTLVPAALARPVHYFDCKDCHTATIDLYALGNSNLCLKCHCHSNGQGANATPDWDLAASGACGSCHGARVGDVAVIASGSHSKHVSDVNGPQLGCDACHGAGASSGGHAGYVNGVIDTPDNSLCLGCHAVDAGEVAPVWGNPATASCESCHSGATLSVINGQTAPAKLLAASSGHNKPNGTYTLSGNAAANKVCTICHDSTSAGHFDGVSGDDTRLSAGFDCASCHGTVLTHKAKACTACHDPHGSSNGYMIYSSQATQNAKDASVSDKFGGDVVFTAKTGADSFDEADGVNTDDICATCHATTSHNNRAATGTHRAGDLRGSDCTQCHTHAKAFRPVGTSCNQCHGNAPTTGAHAFHAIVAAHTTAEDRSDCAACHTGADLYTYDPLDDIANGRNHSDAAGRKTTLTASVGYNTTDKNCTSACHKSTLADGAWNDVDGLNCDACHYWNAAPSAAGNDAYLNAAGAGVPLSGKHSKHFAITTDPLVWPAIAPAPPARPAAARGSTWEAAPPPPPVGTTTAASRPRPRCAGAATVSTPRSTSGATTPTATAPAGRRPMSPRIPPPPPATLTGPARRANPSTTATSTPPSLAAPAPSPERPASGSTPAARGCTAATPTRTARPTAMS